MDQSEVSCDNSDNSNLTTQLLYLLGIKVSMMIYEVIFYVYWEPQSGTQNIVKQNPGRARQKS